MSTKELKEEKQEESSDIYNTSADDFTNRKQDALSMKNKDKVRRFLKGIGLGFLYVGGAWFGCLLNVVRFMFVGGAVIAIIGVAISLIFGGSIFFGIILLLIGTPIVFGITSFLFDLVFGIFFQFFIFGLFLAIISGIIWLVLKIFSLDISFENIMDSALIVVLFGIFLLLAFFLAKGFIEAFKNKTIKIFLKEAWFYILLLFLFLWILF